MKALFKNTGWLMVLMIFTLGACTEEPPPKELIRPVKTEAVKIAQGEMARTFSGVSQAATEASLSFRLAGILEKIHVVVGQRVSKSDLIATLDDADANLDLDKAIAAEKSAVVQLEAAKSNLERIRGLYENNNISLSEYESAKGKYAAAQSELEAARKNIVLRKRELGYHKLYSPMDGVIASKEANENENVSAGQTIVEINSEGELNIEVGIPGSFIPSVIEGQEVKVTFSSLPGQDFIGVVTEVSYTISSSSYTYPVKIRLMSLAPEIRPGMPADVMFAFSQNEEVVVMLVPPNTVREDADGHFVYVVEPEQEGFAIVKRRKVDVGDLTNEGFQIFSGLETDDQVITSGIDKMFDGMRVRLLKS